MKPKEKPTTNEMLPANPSQDAQERAEELQKAGRYIHRIVGDQVIHCDPNDVERHKNTYRCFNRVPQKKGN